MTLREAVDRLRKALDHLDGWTDNRTTELHAMGGGADHKALDILVRREPTRGGLTVLFAYADPPYVGQAHRYPENTEVDMGALMQRLDADHDGWALSCSSPSLVGILRAAPDAVRVFAWCKRFAPHRPGVWPTYAWEPVIAKPMPRPAPRAANTPFDWFLSNPGGLATKRRSPKRQAVLGQKPPEFVHWLLSACNVHPDDKIADIFPGSGAVAAAVDSWRRQQPIPFPHAVEVKP